ncbi:MAG: hypothetical protein Q7R77_00725 [Candidatus Daviesbacteria bacterium]|nr:hypothetical protein [Candidatus Daviesbacteria bacterium]
MKKHSGTLTEIIEGEHNKTLNALNKYGGNFAHNLMVFQLLESFFTEFKAPQDIFLRFYYSVRNFYLLTLFSIIRLHHAQSSLNLRQLIESGTDAAYSIAFPDVEKFAKTDEFGIMDSTIKLKSKRYKWLSKNYPATSKAILKIKEPVQVSSHSNLVDTNRGYKFLSSKEGAQIQVSYFDFEDDYMEKAALWQLANTTLAIMGLWYEVSQSYKSIEVMPDFAEKHSNLMKENQKIKDGVMQTERFQKADTLARTREAKRTRS